MKLFAGLTIWALPLAALAGFMFGGLWYTLLAKPWMAAAGLTKQRIETGGGQTPAMLVLTFVSQLIMAWMLAGLILHMQRAGIKATAVNGMISGAFIWFGFIATTLAVSHRYQMRPWSLTAIDGAHWLIVLLLQGAILGRFGMA
jgi:Protein of unknown function (DUF1761)